MTHASYLCLKCNINKIKMTLVRYKPIEHLISINVIDTLKIYHPLQEHVTKFCK